jgi:hypothetical protein
MATKSQSGVASCCATSGGNARPRKAKWPIPRTRFRSGTKRSKQLPGRCLVDHGGLARSLGHTLDIRDAIGRPKIADNSPAPPPKPQSHQIQEGVISIKPP